MPPVVLHITTPNATLLNQDVTIFCLVTGNPIPNIEWQKHGLIISEGYDVNINISSFVRDIPEGIDGSTVASFNTDKPSVIGLLHFKSVTRNDTSNYTCTARVRLVDNKNYTNLSEPVLLEVLGKKIEKPLKLAIKIFMDFY